MKWKVIDWFLAVLLLIFVAVQYNDPDPALWMLVYGAAAVACIASAFNKYSINLMIPMAGAYLILSALHVDGMLEWLKSPNRKRLFDDVAKMQYPYIEEAREFLGLLICLCVLLYLFYRQRSYSRSQRGTKSSAVTPH